MHILFTLGKKRIGLLLIAIITSILGSLCKLAPLFAIYFMSLEILAETVNAETIQTIVLWTMAAIIARWLLLLCGNSLAHVAAYTLLYDVRIAIAHRLTLLPLGYISARSSGDIKRVLQEDAEQIEGFISHQIPDISSAAATFFGGGLCLFIINPLLACIVLAPLPFALLLQVILAKTARPVIETYALAAGRMNANIVEFIRAIPVIKSFGRDGASMQELKHSVHDFQDIVADFCHAATPIWVAYTVLLGSSLAFMLPFGGWQLLQGSTNIATFIFFLLIGVGLIQNLTEIVGFGNQLSAFATCFAKIQNIMEAPILETPEKTRLPQEFSLEFTHVSFSYDSEKKSKALTDVNILCKAGTTTAIVGPSGAGKSTLAQLASRFWDPQEGSIAIGGIPLSAMHAETLNKLVATVFQDIFLFQDTLQGNICMGQEVEQKELIEVAKAAQIHDFIMTLPMGYQTVLGERGARLSGGQKQRLAIARAMMKKAPIILLDEATAYADPVSERKIHAAIQHLCANSTVFIIAHRLSSIRNADQIIVMDEGRVVDSGSHATLLTQCSLYARLWSAWESVQEENTDNVPHKTLNLEESSGHAS